MNRRSTRASGTDRMPSGVPGFDDITNGGLPRGALTVVLGAAGTGKTVFALQVLASGAREHGEPGIFVAFEENGAHILANLSAFEWADSVIPERGVHLLDAQLSQAVEHGGAFDLIGLLAVVKAKAEQVGARRIVFDGIDVLLGYLESASRVRQESFRLRDWVHESGLAAIVTAKADALGNAVQPGLELLDFMADCVVAMHHRVAHGIALRFLRVVKYRGAAHSANEFPITITHAGVEIAGNTTVEMSYPASAERISTGVERLDAMLTGGYYRGSSVLVTGVPGTAKTSLAAAFAEAAAKRGEKTLYVSFDESPAQIVRNVSSIGMSFSEHIDSGMLHLRSLRGRAESPEAHVARIRSLLSELQPKNLVIDPLSALSQFGNEPDAEGAALQVIELAKRAGITTVATSLVGNAAPLSEQTPLNVSAIADTWMHLTYLNQGGERNRTLTIIKARGTGHSNQVRELVLSGTGVTLADVYAVGGEVLMGTLRWEKENEARKARTAAHNGAVLRQKKAAVALAATSARIDDLVRQRAIQEAELERLQIDGAAEAGHRADETDELLQRRDADPEADVRGNTVPS